MTKNFAWVVGSLIPARSVLVSFCASKAANIAADTTINGLYQRVFPFLLALFTGIFSAANGLSYLIEIPFRIPLDLIQFRWIALWMHPFESLWCGLSSILLTLLTVSIAIAGLFTPCAFSLFQGYSPPNQPYQQALLERIKEQEKNILDLEKQIVTLKTSSKT